MAYYCTEEEKILFKVLIRALNICKREILSLEEPEVHKNIADIRV